MSYVHSDLLFLKMLNHQKTITPPEQSVSDFISRCRIMPPGTPFPGPVDLKLTPHAIEWMDNMSPYSPIQRQVILKASQIAATFAIECIIGYWMREFPTAIMYLSATKELLEKWGTKRLEPMIDSIGMREKIIEHAETQFGRKSRRTGDKTFSKQFIGGFLEMASAQSPSTQRSDSIRIMIRDEIDGAPSQLTTGEGNWLKTSASRTKFWGDRKKITDLSTPSTYELSNIYKEYEIGDCRHYFVPCPMCGKYQFLYWLPEDGNHGLRGDTTAGELTDVYYLCEHCHDAIHDISKYDMFNAGKWEPTKKSWSPTYRSYYVNSLYSPPRTVSWKDYYTEWLISKDDPEEMRGFTNLYGGMPYRETGTRPKIEKVIELRGIYLSGTVPNNVLYITGGGDVQRGKKIYEHFTDKEIEEEIEKNNQAGKNIWMLGFPRIELEILGHGDGYRTFSIEYKVFYGHIHDTSSGAWEKLRRWMYDTEMIYSRADGSKIFCEKMFIDSGDGEYHTVVYDFCSEFIGLFPCKGDQELKKDKHIKGDEITNKSYSKYSKTKIGEHGILIVISTVHYKILIYNNLRKQRSQSEDNPPHFMEFPRDYPDHYFKMLTAEERHLDNSFHAGGRRNESLDCRVYALCAGDIWLDDRISNRRDTLIKGGMNRDAAKLALTYSAYISALREERADEMKKLLTNQKT